MPIYKTSREEIIKESFKVFLKKGYYHTSISDLSEACKIEKPHFYYYFKSKKDLMVSVLNFGKEWAINNMFIHAYKKNLSPYERMKNLLEVLKSIHVKGYAGCIFGNTALETSYNEDEFAQVIKAYFAIWKEALMNIYIEKYDTQESGKRAIRFFNELNGAVLMTKLYKDISYIEGFINNQLSEL